MAAQFARNVGRVAAAAVLSLAMGGVMAMAQENSAAPQAAQQQDQHEWMGHGGPHGPGGREHHLEMMTKRLNLSPDQVSQMKGIEDDAMSQAKGVHGDTSMSQEDRHSKMKSIHEAAMTKMRAVLNDEQRAKFDAMQAHHRERMEHGNGQAPAPVPQA